jgi:hypothetical protein
METTMHARNHPGAAALPHPVRGFTHFALSQAVGAPPGAAAARPEGSAPSDADFIYLQQAFRASGGLAHGDELAARLHVDGAGGYARLARWIVGRQVFSFSWHEHFWLPMFQFEPPDLGLRAGLRPVLSELVDVMDGWAVANWFARPNEALGGHSPVAKWRNHWPDVFEAARLQRFVMKG